MVSKMDSKKASRIVFGLRLLGFCGRTEDLKKEGITVKTHNGSRNLYVHLSENGKQVVTIRLNKYNTEHRAEITSDASDELTHAMAEFLKPL